MTVITSGSATVHSLFDIRAVWHAIVEFVGAAVGALTFAAVIWALLAVPGLFS